MSESEKTEVVNVFTRLAAARSQFHKMLAEGEIHKSGWNSFLEYKYFELDDIVPPGLKCLHDNGLCTTPVTCNGMEVKMSVVESETANSIEFGIPMSKANMKGHEIQGLGAVITYSRRYLWLMLMEVVEPELVEISEATETHKPTDPATEKQMEVLRSAYKEGKLPEEAAATLTKLVNSGKKVTIEQASALIESLQLNMEKAA